MNKQQKYVKCSLKLLNYCTDLYDSEENISNPFDLEDILIDYFTFKHNVEHIGCVLEIKEYIDNLDEENPNPFIIEYILKKYL